MAWKLGPQPRSIARRTKRNRNLTSPSYTRFSPYLRLPLTLRQSFTTEPFVFTGLIETTGKLVRRTPSGRDARLVVTGPLGGEPLALGESIAVDGVCLTVAKIVDGQTFEADASSETLAKTTLGGLEPGRTVNLERALAVGQRIGGHIVTGHVDGVGKIVAQEPVGGALKVTFEAPADLAKFIA